MHKIERKKEEEERIELQESLSKIDGNRAACKECF